jgi:hypothetical protein
VPELNYQCNVQNSRFKSQFNFFYTNIYFKYKQNQWKKSQQGCTRKVINDKYICCTIWEMNPEPCNPYMGLKSSARKEKHATALYMKKQPTIKYSIFLTVEALE